MQTLHKIGFGGGCHWCTEAVFVNLRGVVRVEQGWIGSAPPHDFHSEAVVVYYEPSIISSAALIEVHLRTHAADTAHALRHKYRSAVYYFGVVRDVADVAGDGVGDEDRFRRELAATAGRLYPDAVVTQVLPAVTFRSSPVHYRDYYRTDPDRPFCVRYIAPKLRDLRQSVPELLQ